MKKYILKLLILLVEFIINLSKTSLKRLERLALSKDDITMKLTVSTYDESGSAFFIFENPNLLDNYSALKEIFMILQDNSIYNSLGDLLIVFITVNIVPEEDEDEDDTELIKSLHPNWLIQKDVDFEQYYAEIDKHVTNVSDKSSYSMDKFVMYRLNFWNMDDYKSKSIKMNSMSRELLDQKERDEKVLETTPINSKPLGVRGLHTSAVNYAAKDVKKAPLSIKPIKRLSKAVKEFSTLDIETMNVNNEQQPVMVSFTHSNPSKNGYFLISKDIINNPPLYVKLLWDSVFNHIILS